MLHVSQGKRVYFGIKARTQNIALDWTFSALIGCRGVQGSWLWKTDGCREAPLRSLHSSPRIDMGLLCWDGQKLCSCLIPLLQQLCTRTAAQQPVGPYIPYRAASARDGPCCDNGEGCRRGRVLQGDGDLLRVLRVALWKRICLYRLWRLRDCCVRFPQKISLVMLVGSIL